MSEHVLDRADHWADFYKTQARQSAYSIPSQFAAFVAQEIAPDCLILDIGCGNGRDSIFFARYGFRVVAADASENALRAAADVARENNITSIAFDRIDVGGATLVKTLERAKGKKKCVYARFFLHAITEDEQAAFFNGLQDALEPGDIVAFEYRTTADAEIDKEASPHFRRYQSAAQLNAQLTSLGFHKQYSVEGRGFAKFKSEDAVVARCIFSV